MVQPKQMATGSICCPEQCNDKGRGKEGVEEKLSMVFCCGSLGGLIQEQ